jgi:hypothetical protein
VIFSTLTGIGCVKKPKSWPAQSFTENKTAFVLECHLAAISFRAFR